MRLSGSAGGASSFGISPEWAFTHRLVMFVTDGEAAIKRAKFLGGANYIFADLFVVHQFIFPTVNRAQCGVPTSVPALTNRNFALGSVGQLLVAEYVHVAIRLAFSIFSYGTTKQDFRRALVLAW